MNKSGWGKETLRCAALQYANGQVKHCDGLNETLHSFPNVFRVSFIYVKFTIILCEQVYRKCILQCTFNYKSIFTEVHTCIKHLFFPKMNK